MWGSAILIPEQTLSNISVISPPWGLPVCWRGLHQGNQKSAHLHIAHWHCHTENRHHWVKPIDRLHGSQPLPLPSFNFHQLFVFTFDAACECLRARACMCPCAWKQAERRSRQQSSRSDDGFKNKKRAHGWNTVILQISSHLSSLF